MKILAIADRPPKNNILKILEQNEIDLICTLGDLDQYQISELKDVSQIPKIGVYGNHDSGVYMEELGIKNMHLQTWEYQGLVFGGFEGSHKYKESSYSKMYTQDEATALLTNFPYVDVMICHSPPFGINDEIDSLSHQGFKALTKYIETEKPKYLLHGHTYPEKNTQVHEFLNTKIIYVTADKIIEIN